MPEVPRLLAAFLPWWISIVYSSSSRWGLEGKTSVLLLFIAAIVFWVGARLRPAASGWPAPESGVPARWRGIQAPLALAAARGMMVIGAGGLLITAAMFEFWGALVVIPLWCFLVFIHGEIVGFPRARRWQTVVVALAMGPVTTLIFNRWSFDDPISLTFARLTYALISPIDWVYGIIAGAACALGPSGWPLDKRRPGPETADGGSPHSLLVVGALLATLAFLHPLVFTMPSEPIRLPGWGSILVGALASTGPLVAARLLRDEASAEDGRLPWALFLSTFAMSLLVASRFLLGY